MASIRIESIGIRYGIYTAVALIGYFLLMQLIGLGHILEFRAFNLVILLVGIILAEEHYKMASAKKYGVLNRIWVRGNRNAGYHLLIFFIYIDLLKF